MIRLPDTSLQVPLSRQREELAQHRRKYSWLQDGDMWSSLPQIWVTADTRTITGQAEGSKGSEIFSDGPPADGSGAFLCGVQHVLPVSAWVLSGFRGSELLFCVSTVNRASARHGPLSWSTMIPIRSGSQPEAPRASAGSISTTTLATTPSAWWAARSKTIR